MTRNALLVFIFILSITLSACGTAAPSPAAAASTATTSAPSGPASATPDLCSPAELPNSVRMVNNFVRQFDSYATLATNVAQSDLAKVIPAMQAIRTATDEAELPACLTVLRRDALLYMDTVIKTLVAFQKNPKLETLNAGILEARKYNDQYAAELARLMGVTLVPNATQGTPAAGQPAESATPVVVTVLNPGPNALNLHVSPSLTAESIGVLDANLSTTATGKSADGEWLLVNVPNQAGKTAWLYASLVQFSSGDENALPVTKP